MMTMKRKEHNRFLADCDMWRKTDKKYPRGYESCGPTPGFGSYVEPTLSGENALEYALYFNGQGERHLQVEAGTVGTWAFHFRPRNMPILPGGSIRIFRETNNMVLARGMQRVDPVREHYCTLQRTLVPNGVRFRHFGYHLKDNFLAVIEITKTSFQDSSDTIILTIGETSGGALPTDVPSFAMFNCRYWVDVDFTGRGLYHRLCPPIIIDVMPGEPYRLAVIAPSVVRPGEKFHLHVRAEDASFNPWAIYVGELKLYFLDGRHRNAKLKENDWGIARFDDLSIEKEGVYRLEAKGSDDKISGISNPILCSSHAPRIVWGDTHCHTYLNDGHGSIEHNFRSARDVSFLDFFAITEHTHSVRYCEEDGANLPVKPLSLDQIVMRESTVTYWQPYYETLEEYWRECQIWAKQFSRDGDFIAFLGYEWQPLREDIRNSTIPRGDFCVLYKDLNSSVRRPLKLEKLLAMLNPDIVIALPHHGGRCDSLLGLTFDSTTVPSIEVASMHDRAEFLGQRGLHLGMKVGFHGASDGHMGRPGYDVWPPKGGRGWPFYRRYHGERSAITGVIVDEFSRGEIWNNFLTRRHYATTGHRILLQFFCGETPMGGEIVTNKSPIFDVRVHGTARIVCVEIIRADRVAHVEKCNSLDVVFSWRDPNPQRGETPYYIRVTQENDAFAWSSPIYVTYTGISIESPINLPNWNETIWPREADASHDPDLEGQALNLFKRRCETVSCFKDLRLVGIYQDDRGKYVLLRAQRDNYPIQWKMHYGYPDWRISGKRNWYIHG